MRETFPFNFDWYVDSFKDSHLKDVNLDAFEKVNLPHHGVEIPYNNFNEKMLEVVLTYVKRFDVKDSWKHKKVFLRFEGIAHQADIYVNKKHVTKHKGGYVFFEVDISDYIEIGRENELMVIVDSNEDSSIPPFGGVVDYLGYCGIYREVSLVVLEDYYVKDVYIHTDGKRIVKFEIETSNNEGIVIYKIKDKDMQVVSKGMVILDDTFTKTETFIEHPTLWDVDNPYLYTAEIHYEINQKLMDFKQVKFGIRRIRFDQDGFYLNEKQLKIRGLNRHQSFPYVGYAMPKSMQKYDADILKYDLGLNLVRTSHYPQSTHFLNRADEIGLLVFEEIPGWQHIGDEAWQNQSLNDVTQMILRDRNHPSIIMWGVRINESPDHHTFYKKTNELARKLDPTRPTGGVRNIQHSDFLEDVYTYNDFSHTGKNKGLDDKKHITKKNPYLVTEYNGHMFPTKRFDTESKRVEHALRHMNVLDSMMKSDNGISGAIGWCMSDYHTHEQFGSGDKICYHGVLDMYRLPKYAAYSYASQKDDHVVLEVLSTMNLGEHNGGLLPDIHVLTNVDYIKLYKNNEYIDTFYPDSKAYPYVKHPPIVIKDFIGKSLAKNENMKEKDAEKAKTVFKAISIYGNRLPLRYKLKMLFLLKRYKLTIDQGIKLFYKYTSGWGSDKLIYRFEGYKDQKLVKTVLKENVISTAYVVTASKNELTIKDTYDVMLYHVKKIDQNGELVPYASDAFEIEVDGPIELIGPKYISLIGGGVGFFIKSKESGLGKIKIIFNDQVIEREVKVSDAR
ncbi:MAG: glycoside hydrolase family 2 TIM barrel-domain containing protein [Acholeplasmataceae bacterium]|nr:glycoside hydrolase family 2 TIM barrel-domain containing protein [Acholeplasmataceae bacterium]